MIRYLAAEDRKQSTRKSVLSTYFTIVGIVCWFCVTGICAAENDTSDNEDGIHAAQSNAAQDQKAENLAQQAAIQDPAVADEYALAEKTGNTEKADALYGEKVDAYNSQIAEMRASGMGWGDIAHQLDVHPSALGLGHSKKNESRKGFFSTLSRVGSEIKAAVGGGMKRGTMNRGNAAVGTSSKGKTVGSSRDKGRGLTMGSRSDGNGGRGNGGGGVGRGGGHGGGNGGGHGGGSGGGNGGGHGGGNGGGNGGGHGGGNGGGNGGGKK